MNTLTLKTLGGTTYTVTITDNQDMIANVPGREAFKVCFGTRLIEGKRRRCLIGYENNTAIILTEADYNLLNKTRGEKLPDGWKRNPVYEGMTNEEIEKAARAYDRLHNEGGEGYNPYRDNLYIAAN